MQLQIGSKCVGGEHDFEKKLQTFKNGTVHVLGTCRRCNFKKYLPKHVEVDKKFITKTSIEDYRKGLRNMMSENEKKLYVELLDAKIKLWKESNVLHWQFGDFGELQKNEDLFLESVSSLFKEVITNA